MVGWNPAPFLGELPGLVRWIRIGSSVSSLGRKKPWRNGCKAWGTTNCKRRRPGGWSDDRDFFHVFWNGKHGNPDFMDFCKTKTDEKVESEAQTGGNGLYCRGLLYVSMWFYVYIVKYIFFLSMIYPLFPWIWWGLWVFHMGWRWLEHPPPVVDGVEVGKLGMLWTEPWWFLVELGILCLTWLVFLL